MIHTEFELRVETSKENVSKFTLFLNQLPLQYV